MKNVRAHVFITGRVQGVFFRMYTKEQADALGLSGWVRNVDSEKLKVKNEKFKNFTGVEAVFEGEKDKVEEMIKWCKNGSPSANVSDVEIEWEPFDEAQGKEPERLEGFEIKR